MEFGKHTFLAAVVGDDAATALAKAEALGPDVAWAIFPRAVLSWIDVVAATDFSGTIPGTDINLTLKKHEGTYSGSVSSGDKELYSFCQQPLFHVAGSVVVAVAGDGDPAPPLTSPALARLGKSIDLLVRSRTLRKMQRQKTQGGASGGKGKAAAPIAPVAPVQPDPTAPATNQKAKTKPSTANPPAIKISKAQAQQDCGVCGGLQFKGSAFTGCACFRTLAKSVKVTDTGTHFVVVLGPDWDVDARLTWIEGICNER